MAPLSALVENRNLFNRILSGVVLAPVAILFVLLGGLAFDGAVVAAAALGLAEWLRLVTRKPQSWSAILFLIVLGVELASGLQAALLALAIAALAVAFIVWRLRGAGLLAAFGLPYVGFAMLSLIWLRQTATGGWPLVLFVFLVVWGSDIGAYVVGRWLGGAKLAPSISPNKTWAGFGGGLIFSACIALIWTATMARIAHPFTVAAMAIGLSILGQCGDLFESMMKRRFGVKDSGNLIPGHGGMLDRIDALLWVAPAFAALHWFGLTGGLLS
jgi:phosphatidate cytidylyltransferase